MSSSLLLGLICLAYIYAMLMWTISLRDAPWWAVPAQALLFCIQAANVVWIYTSIEG